MKATYIEFIGQSLQNFIDYDNLKKKFFDLLINSNI